MNSSIEVFICYTHEDKDLLHVLEKHLRLLKEQGFIDNWYDQDINAGTEWEWEVRRHLDMASIILLLVSPDFLTSDHCYTNEMRRAMDRHQRGMAFVIPIILRPVEWRGTVFGGIQALPTGGKPITTWSDRDLAFLDVVQGIRRVAEIITSRSLDSSPISSKSSATTTPPLSPAASRERENIAELSNGKKRLKDLENTIRDSYSFIRGYESILRLIDDPREKLQAHQSIDRQENVIKDFLGEYMELANQLGVIVPIDIIQISASIGSNGGTVPKKDYFAIRNTLSHFSDWELRLLGLDLGIDIDMFPGEDMEAKVLDLLDYCKQSSRMDELLAYLQHKRPSLKFVS